MTKLTEQILRERGIRLAKTQQGLRIVSEAEDGLKTDKMRLLEIKHQQPIGKLITGASLRAIGKRLGLNASTIHYWRRRLGLDG